jgi:hypothetical protein
MATIIVGNKNIGGILRVGENAEIAEAVKVDGKWITGKTVAYIRHKPEYTGMGDGGEFFEIEIPTWDYAQEHFMIVVRQKNNG